jgi:hypothetical protein
MNKPNNFDVTPSGDFIPVAVGGHYAVIKQVEEREDKNGDPMIVVYIDFDKTDSQPEYFAESFRADVRPDKKWSNAATNYITSERDGVCTRNFKKFIKSYTDSNGLKEDAVSWGSDFCNQFKNKKIGVVFGRVEETYNGETKMRTKIRWFCDYNKVADQKVPEDKYENGSTSAASSSSSTNSFLNVSSDEELPFK